tara:strand:- start:326 stop:604 length:279 start_codon:yes stop_codon:yes gene_type:complete
MKYFAIHNDAIQIENSDVSEVTITLHTFKPKITIKNPSYISGVYNDNGDSVTKLPVIYVDSYDSTIINKKQFVSLSEQSEVTLKLNTKLIKS